MLQIPRIALYRPHEDDNKYLSACFPREEYSVRVVDSAEEILTLIAEEGSAFDAIILPPKSRDNDGGLTFCARLRQMPDLERTPVIALTDDAAGHVIRALYDEGAHVVFVAPFNPRIIFCQINALHRLRMSFDEQVHHAFELSGLRNTTTKALNCAREGILLFDPARTITFLNTAAARLLGISWDTPVEQIDRIAGQFHELINQHETSALSAGELARQDIVSELPMSLARMQVSRAGGQPFFALVRALTLVGDRGELYGTAVAFTDLSEFATLHAQVQQAQRSRSLSLVAASGCLEFAKTNPQLKNLSAAALFQQIGSGEEQRSSFSQITTAFLETIDLVVPPSVQVKLNLGRDIPLGLKPSELFQILGHLVLEGVDFCGVGGVIEMTATEMPEFGSFRLTVTAHSSRPTPLAPADHFSALLQGATSIPEESEGALPFGLAAAREILKRYGETPVTQERPDDRTLILRVLLPQISG